MRTKKPRKIRNGFGIHVIVMLVLMLFHTLVPLRILLLASFAFLLIFVACALIFWKAVKEEPIRLVSWILELFAIFLIFMFRFSSYTFAEASTTPFLIPSAVFGVVAAVFLLVKYFWKNQKLWGRVGTFFLIWLLSAFFALSTLLHANFAFDFDEPKEYVAVIEERDWDAGGRKSPTTYDFTVTIEGETLEIDVPRGDYKHYQSGDTYRIYRYDGALGKPFYVASGWVK